MAYWWHSLQHNTNKIKEKEKNKDLHINYNIININNISEDFT